MIYTKTKLFEGSSALARFAALKCPSVPAALRQPRRRKTNGPSDVRRTRRSLSFQAMVVARTARVSG